MGKSAPILLALGVLLLSSQLFAGWFENVEVRVLDSHLLPIPNATVNITYQLSDGRGYVTTKNWMTDSNGRVKITIENVEYDNKTTDYTYIVRASFGNSSATETFTYGVDKMPRTIQLEVYALAFFVKDTDGKALSVSIRMDSKLTAKTNANGFASLLVEKGPHTATLTYGTNSKDIRFTMDDDRTINVTFKQYEVVMRVLDDTGAPLDAELHLGVMKASTNADGYAYFYNVTDSQPLLNAYYGRYRQNRLINLDIDRNFLILFDTHPPTIQALPAEWDGHQLKVRAIITDPGDYASGLREGNSSIQIYYIDKDNFQKKLTMYSVGHNLYEGVIPLAEDVPALRYIIQATDATGNSKSSSDTFVIPTRDPSAVEGGGAPPIDVSSNSGRIENIAPFGMLVLLVALIGIGAWYYSSKKKAGLAYAGQKEIVYPPPKDQKGGLGGTVPTKTGSQESAKPPPVPPALPKP
jgi:hypothetical protein